MNPNKLKEILRLHELWLEGDKDGKRADLTNAILRDADLRGADLTYANLAGANLSHADLTLTDLEGANLKGANLKGAYLTYADLEGAILFNANLEGADLTRAILCNADLRDATFKGANLAGANLKGAYLTNAVGHRVDSTKANLTEANLTQHLKPQTKTMTKLKEILRRHKLWCEGDKDGKRADLTNAILIDADLRYAYLTDAILRGANLTKAYLTDANLSDADLRYAYLSGANLKGAYLFNADLTSAYLFNADLTGANLSRADLTGANLSRADLTGANLSHANLAGANLSHANLTLTDLEGANLAGANLKGAYLTNADLTGADLSDAILTDATFKGATFKGANLFEANLYMANLSHANLRDAILTDAILTGADLTGADLTGANLADANLTRAELSDADLFRANVDLQPPSTRTESCSVEASAEDVKKASDPVGDGIGFVVLQNKHEDPALGVVNSARISYQGSKVEFDEADKKLTSYLLQHGHGSPYRHQFYTFHLAAPLFLFKQIQKYQVGCTWREYEVGGESVSLEAFDIMYDTDKGCSWNEVSGRYTQTSTEVYVPRVMRTNPSHGSKQASVELSAAFDHEAERQLMQLECDRMLTLYKQRVSRGVAKEIARMTLPQSMYSQAYWTVSLQGVLHFLQQRLDKDAQWEIRQYALAIKELIQPDLDKMGITLNE